MAVNYSYDLHPVFILLWGVFKAKMQPSLMCNRNISLIVNSMGQNLQKFFHISTLKLDYETSQLAQ